MEAVLGPGDHRPRDVQVSSVDKHVPRAVVSLLQACVQRSRDSGDVVRVGGHHLRGLDECLDEPVCVDEGHRCHAYALAIRYFDIDDAAILWQARLFDEAQARLRASHQLKEPEERRRVVVSAKHDCGGNGRQLLEHVDTALHFGVCGAHGVEQVASVEDEIRPLAPGNIDDLCEHSLVVRRTRNVVGHAPEVPVRGVQQPHLTTARRGRGRPPRPLVCPRRR